MTVSMTPDPYTEVIAMTEEDARRFLDVSDETRVEDGGPLTDPDDLRRYRPGVRVWRVYTS